MIVLSASEAEELIEHFRTRPDIWWQTGPSTFLRRTGEEFALALKLHPHPQQGLWGLVVKTVTWHQQTVDTYIAWLLEKYTAYTNRRELIVVLQGKLKPGTDIEQLSAQLAELKGTHFLRRREPRSLEHVQLRREEETTA